MSQHPAQQRVALVGRTRCGTVEGGQKLLYPRELRRVVRVVSDVQLAPQHPLAHLAHDQKLVVRVRQLADLTQLVKRGTH